MTSMKTMMMMVVDAGPTMQERLPSCNDSKIKFVGSLLSTYIMQRMMASKTVEFGVASYGNDNTKNYLNSSQGGYEGVVEIVEMEKPSAATLTKVLKMKNGKRKADLIDGVVVGQDVLVRVNQKKAYNRIMLLITDGETAVDGIEDLETVVGQMNTITNFGLYIGFIGKVSPTSSVVKRENAKLLKSVAESVGGRFMEIDNLGETFHLLSSGPGLGTKPQMGKLTFEISPGCRIPCVAFGKVMKVNPPSLKKIAKSAMDVDGDGDDEVEVSAVKRDTTYRNPEDPDEQLNDDEKVKGYKYGSQYVPITVAEEELFKIHGPQGIKLLGFLPAAKIPRHHFLEPPNILQGPAENDVSQVAVKALCQGLRETGQIGLVRYVKRENSDPYLAAILPPLDPADHSLLVYRIPCAEDVREYAFPSLVHFTAPVTLKGAAATTAVNKQNAQKQAIADFVAAHTARNVPGQVVTPFNPTIHNIYTEVHRKLTKTPENQVIHANDPLLPANVYVAPVPSAGEATALKAAFELVKNDTKSTGKRKVFWSELDIKQEGGGATAGAKTARYDVNVNYLAGNVPSQASQITQGSAAGAAAAADLPPFTVGSVQPIEDFEAYVAAAASVANGAELIRGAIKTMQDVIERNIAVGASNAHYKRGVTCLQSMRKVAVAENEHAMFNAYLKDIIKIKYGGGRHRMVWQYVIDEQVSLIHNKEDSGSPVTPAESKAFLNEDKPVVVATTAAAAEAEDDDLFGNMA